MTVKIVNPEPDPSVVQIVICKNCGVKLEYVPIDIKSKTYYSFGESDIYYYIVCANCEKEVIIKGY